MMVKLGIFEELLANAKLDSIETLTVPQMIDELSRIRRCMAEDESLSDLAEPVRSIVVELEKRRRLAIAVADEADADKCLLKN